MKSKAFIILVSVVVLLFAGGFYLLVLKNKDGGTISPVGQEGKSLLPTAAPKLLTWDDPAGFTFRYDADLKINNHPEDQVNYANLEITEAGKEGKILVLASDTKYKDVSEWVAKETKLKGSNAIETTIGGKPAKKVKIADSVKVVVGAIDDKILFTLEMDPAGVAAWQNRFDQIISSYEFVYPTAAAQKSSTPVSGSSEGDIIEEEIIE